MENHVKDRNWKNFHIKYRESHLSPVEDFHEHDYYEINFIVSGNVKILLPDCVDEGTHSRIVLAAPGTPHFVSCKPDLLYSRFYLLFSKEFIADWVHEWDEFSQLFGQNGKVIAISADQLELCRMLAGKLENETNLLRQRLLVLYILSFLEEFTHNTRALAMPAYIMQALTFIESHYPEKITASELAQKLHIGRTTLMTNFKRYTNTTLNHYIIRRRLKKAVTLLQQGTAESEIAEECGFGDLSSLIRSFKHSFGMTPGEYARKTKDTL